MKTSYKSTASKIEIINDSGSTRFKCPSCKEGDIVRTLHERKLATKYTCPKCGFEGPN